MRRDSSFGQQRFAKGWVSCRRRSIDLHPDLPACAGCGRCCHWVVELRPGDVVPEEFVVDRNGARCLDQRSDGACVALDPKSMLCTIYETRPQTCRDFHRGESLCRTVPGRSAPVSI